MKHLKLFILLVVFWGLMAVELIAQNKYTEQMNQDRIQVKECKLKSFDTSDGTPTISLNERYMYFASFRKSNNLWRKYEEYFNRFDFDLFFREKISQDEWSIPYNMGDIVNNENDQGSPNFTPNGKYFYFVSLGSVDTVVWVSKTNGPIFEKPLLVRGDIQKWYEMRAETRKKIHSQLLPQFEETYNKILNVKYSDSYFENLEQNLIDEISSKVSFDAIIQVYKKNNIPDSFWKYFWMKFSISPTGKQIFFCEDFGKTGEYGLFGKGGTDIYIANIDEDGNWEKIESLPNIINTEKDESYPFIASDGLTLFFNRDSTLLKTEYDGINWSEPIELPNPINLPNSGSWEFKISPSGNTAYFRSDREGTKKLYEVDLSKSGELIRQKKVIVVEGIVIDKITRKPLKANVLIDDLDEQKNISVLETNESNGKYIASLLRGKRYGLSVSSEGYLSKSKKFEITKEGEFLVETLNIELQPIESGARTELSNIEFDFGLASLRPESKLELDRLVELLLNYSDIKILIEGHTDDVGSDKYNLNLSLKRAESVRDYLISRDISKERLKVSGLGKKVPKVKGIDEISRQMNRRVEFEIL
ncbi:MAG: OmpA family protein [bacterium]